MIRILSIAAALAAAAAAHAAPPANLAGTTWTLQANRDSQQLVFTTQGGPGAPGASICRALNGTVGNAPIRGQYCPDTGRIVLKHNNIGSGVTVRIFVGSVSDEVIGQPLYMAGTMWNFNGNADDQREFNFSAVK